MTFPILIFINCRRANNFSPVCNPYVTLPVCQFLLLWPRGTWEGAPPPLHADVCQPVWWLQVGFTTCRPWCNSHFTSHHIFWISSETITDSIEGKVCNWWNTLQVNDSIKNKKWGSILILGCAILHTSVWFGTKNYPQQTSSFHNTCINHRL